MDSVSAFRSQLRSDATPDAAPLSRGLGWFSLALGLAELALPRTLARAIGVEPRSSTSWLLRAMGARELLAGLGLLTQPQRPLPLWSRVAGDVIGLAVLGVTARSKRRSPRLAGVLAALTGVTVLDVIAARRTQRRHDEANRPVTCSVTISRPPAEVYAFFRQLSQLPLFMDYLQSVREADARYSHWIAKLPLGRTISWDLKITEDRPGELIAWRSVEGSLFKTRGRVTFAKAPGRDVTEVRVEMQLDFLGTKPSTSVATFFTRAQIEGDLGRLKQVLETGEVLHPDASLHHNPHHAARSPASQGATITQPPVPFIPSPAIAERR